MFFSAISFHSKMANVLFEYYLYKTGQILSCSYIDLDRLKFEGFQDYLKDILERTA